MSDYGKCTNQRALNAQIIVQLSKPEKILKKVLTAARKSDIIIKLSERERKESLKEDRARITQLNSLFKFFLQKEH